MAYTESQKKAIYKWRQSHREEHLQCLKECAQRYYQANKENVKERNRDNARNYYWRKKAERLDLQNGL